MARLILIVEDNPMLRRGMVALLRPHGHGLIAAGTVAGARQFLAGGDNNGDEGGAGRPSHAIVDLNLPDGTGVDVLADLRARGLDTRVLLLTGSVDADLIAAARRFGVDAVVTKPPDWDRVVQWAGRTESGSP